MKGKYGGQGNYYRRIKIVYKGETLDRAMACSVNECKRAIATWFRVYALWRHLGAFYFETYTIRSGTKPKRMIL